ncbi:MAG: D-2-hydroxyacid dehydrogenase [Novosphingobium sp. 32-60-15]|uniref:D-2-hydroxyacid dehydrogenase n=1 Tax=unclassified Novosphingobium TaxID=2644732 RepID=UPI000BDCF984|nr:MULTISPECIES: D-2-hydroxyacid dehydrogenase [unclassified Novosphingobium]OYX64804.1 MAG: D-2-hydroxyacid dehydrogenase [Novosphingobium sp. 32-60-15]
MTILVMNAMVAPLVESHLPDWVEPRFFHSTEELLDFAPQAEIGWFDLHQRDQMAEAIGKAKQLKWLNSIYAGVDFFPLDLLRTRGVVLTNGVGINAITIAEYVVMAMLTVAKGYREVVRAQDRHEWLLDSPGKVELSGSRALILGYGAIGQLVERRLAGFDVEVVKVRRSGGDGVLRPDQWREQLGTFDWVILAVPATPETDHMICAAELAAMKPDATLINIARGSVIDQDALVQALKAGRPGQAFLDVTTPEPLPANHPLWSLPNAHITMHLSGRAQTKMFQRSATRFLENLGRFHRGERLEPQVDLSLGY